MIQAWVDARTYGTKGAGFSVQMVYCNHLWRRSFVCGKITSNQAELKAVEFILASILPKFYNEELNIDVSGRYAPLMLEHEQGWTKEAIKNVELIERVRSLLIKFKSFKVKSVNVNDHVAIELKRITEDTVKSGKCVDRR